MTSRCAVSATGNIPFADGSVCLFRAQSFCYKQFRYSEHTQTTFGDSGAGVIVNGGIGNAFRNKKIESDGISADDGMLRELKGEKEITGDGTSHNT